MGWEASKTLASLGRSSYGACLLLLLRSVAAPAAGASGPHTGAWCFAAACCCCVIFAVSAGADARFCVTAAAAAAAGSNTTMTLTKDLAWHMYIMLPYPLARHMHIMLPSVPAVVLPCLTIAGAACVDLV
jgi:hypothetical protein